MNIWVKPPLILLKKRSKYVSLSSQPVELKIAERKRCQKSLESYQKNWAGQVNIFGDKLSMPHSCVSRACLWYLFPSWHFAFTSYRRKMKKILNS